MNGRMLRFDPRVGIRLLAVGIGLLGTGCSGTDFASETTAETTLAVNACNEEVPSERIIDSLPAYAQCDGISSGSIWSNNGVDTSATSLGDDWIRTQQGGGYQCTEWSYRYMRFRWGIHYRHGDAQEWCDGELPDTLVKSTVPVHGDLIIFAGGVCGADESTGHIAVIDTVDNAAERVTFVEQNRAGRRSADQSCATCFLHAVANDGSGAGAGGVAGNGGGATGGLGGVGASGGVATSGGTAGIGGVAGDAGDGAGLGGSGTVAGGAGATGIGGAGATGVAGAPGTAATAGSENVGVGGSLGGGENSGGAASTVGGAAGSAPTAGTSPTTNAGRDAGSSGASGGPPITRTNDTFAPPPDAGCSFAHSSRAPNSTLLWILASLLGTTLARRRPQARLSRRSAPQGPRDIGRAAVPG